MKNWQLLSLLVSSVLWLPASAQVDSASRPKPEIFTVVEQHPEFPGGMNKLGNYLRKNLRYPEAARKAGIEGRGFVNFIVTDQGVIENVNVLKGLGFGTDEEAVRLISSMPNWRPGKQGGKAQNVRYNLVVNFPPNRY